MKRLETLKKNHRRAQMRQSFSHKSQKGDLKNEVLDFQNTVNQSNVEIPQHVYSS
jgi:hypothetical protein